MNFPTCICTKSKTWQSSAAAFIFAGVPAVPTVLAKITLEGCTVNSRYSGHAWDFVKCPLLARVCNSGSYFQSNLFSRGSEYCP